MTPKTIYFDKEVLQFTSAKSSEMLSAKNRTAKPVTFVVEQKAKEPFSCRFNQFEVKPGGYTKIPIQYNPVNQGPHESTIVFKCPVDGIRLKAKLVGNVRKHWK